MTDAEPTDADVWRTSTACQPNDDCVEVAIGGEWVRVRHSRDRAGAALSFTHAEWAAFLAGAQAGEFDLPG